MKVLIGIQARTASTRLPKKIYEKIGEKSVLEHVYEACKRSTLALAMAKKVEFTPFVGILGPEKDEALKEYCEDRKWEWFGGDPEDLTKRYSDGIRHFGAEAFVRITSDCWNIHESSIVDVAYSLGGLDCSSNTLMRTIPEGQDAQGCRAQAFDWIDKNTRMAREHPFFEFENSIDMRYKFERAGFTWGPVVDTTNVIFQRNSIDTLEDLERARSQYASRSKIMERAEPKIISPGGDGDKQQKGVSLR